MSQVQDESPTFVMCFQDEENFFATVGLILL